MTTAIERFWLRVDIDGPVPSHRPDLGPCWLWTGAKLPSGYGRLRHEGRIEYAHRMACADAMRRDLRELNGWDVLHRCDNPPCVRPTHLFVGTQAMNTLDMMVKGRGSPPRSYEHFLHRLAKAGMLAEDGTTSLM